MTSPGPLEVEVRYLDERGGWVCGPLADVDAGSVVVGRPVRSFPTYRNLANYPGWLWSGTMGRLVGYESLLERDRLWLADFDPTVSGIGACRGGCPAVTAVSRVATCPTSYSGPRPASWWSM